MLDFAHQAKSNLSVFLQRGQAALEAFERGQIDEASEWLRKRNAAFHNFRFFDSQIPSGDLDQLAADPEVLQLLSAIRRTDQLLAPRLREAHDQTKAMAHKLQVAQQKIARFRSAPLETQKFEKSA